jgi:hypothetical protein
MAQDAHLAATEAQAQALAVDAYIYFYPLLSMDISRRTFTNVEPGKVFGKGPMNTFTNVPAYPQDHQEDRTELFIDPELAPITIEPLKMQGIESLGCRRAVHAQAPGAPDDHQGI